MTVRSFSPTTQTTKPVALFALLAVGWLALFGPVYLEFSRGAWQRPENGHALFVMGVMLAAIWARLSSTPGFPLASRPEFMQGLLVFAAGLAAIGLGRISEVDILTSASQSIIAFAIVLSLSGWRGVRLLWFPLVLSFFLIIWPGWLIDGATAPLKRFISELVSNGLFAAGMPVAQSGAVISAGPYELLVADACAGLKSIASLTALGVVYLYLVKRRTWQTNVAVLLALIPLAILANIIRVALLVLITLFFGYDAGQSFLHDLAGVTMFALALGGVFCVDALAAALWEPKR